VQDTEWHRITAFNGLGNTIQQYCDTGMKVLVRGRIHYAKGGLCLVALEILGSLPKQTDAHQNKDKHRDP